MYDRYVLAYFNLIYASDKEIQKNSLNSDPNGTEYPSNIDNSSLKLVPQRIEHFNYSER